MSLCVVLTDKADRSKLIQPIVRDLTHQVSKLTFATSLLSGFMTCTMSLAMTKAESLEWYERFLFYGINVLELDASVWEGRISAVTLTDFGIELECEGYWASLADQTMYSWFAANSIDQWRVPSEGAGGISDDISLARTWPEKFYMQRGVAHLAFGFRKGYDYDWTSGTPISTENQRAPFFFRLPHIGDLSDDRLFQPMTIHHIQYEWDVRNLPLFDLKVWSADKPKGTWTEKDSKDVTVDTPGVVDVSVGADASAIEAVAIGAEVNTSIANYPNDDGYDRFVITNITVFAENNATTTDKTTAKKIITNLLTGKSSINVDAHANQIASDLRDVQDSSIQYVPAVYNGKTIQEIIAELTSFGVGIEANKVDNPNLENDVLGWYDEGGAAATWDTAQKYEGTYSAKVTTANAANQGLLIKDRAGSRFAVLANTWYTGSLYVRASATKPLYLRLRWYDNVDVEISMEERYFPIIIDTWTRVSIIAKSPDTAAKVQIEYQTKTAAGVFDLWGDAAMLEQTDRMNPYLAGDQTYGMWSGAANISTSLRVHPAMVGVYGRNRLHVRLRDMENIKWVLPLREMPSDGLQFQRSTLDFYSRIWARYTEAFSGDTAFADLAEAALEQSIIYGQRDRILELGDVTQTFAQSASKVNLADARRIRQRTEIDIKGSILNVAGAREELWRVRAGDVVLVPDLKPYPFVNSVRNPFSIVDYLKTFTVRSTEYDYDTNELTIVPDLPTDRLEQILVGLESTPPLAVNLTSASRDPNNEGVGPGFFG